MANALLQARADPNAQDSNGSTPLIVAARSGFADAALLLIAAKADPTVVDKEGKSAIAYSVTFNAQEQNERTSEGETPILAVRFYMAVTRLSQDRYVEARARCCGAPSR